MKEYSRVYNKQYRLDHPACGPAPEYKRLWYQKNREKQKVRRKQNYIEHRQEYLNRATTWRLNNKAKYNHNQSVAHHRRKQKLLENTPVELTFNQWKEIKELYNYYCAYCLQPFKKLEMDHIIPVSRGGGTTMDNIVPTCRKCNSLKYTKSILEWHGAY